MANVLDTKESAHYALAKDEKSRTGGTQAASLIAKQLSLRLKARRKAMRLSQSDLAQRSGVSLGSLKRFEHDSLISLDSLIRISVALDCQEELQTLFSGKKEDAAAKAASIQEIVAKSHKLLDQISENVSEQAI